MKREDPLVSVIMPVYNCEKYVEEAIDSILNQSYKNIELIIIDDGSKDKSIDIINSYEDERIKFSKNKINKGVSATRNVGLKLAQGKYIAIMDSDDISPLERIEKQVTFLEENEEFGLIGGHYESFKNYLFFTKRKFRKHSVIYKKNKADTNFFCSVLIGTAMMRSDLIKLNNILFETNLKIAEDFDFIRKFSKYSKITNIDELLLHYRKHSNNSIKRKNLVDNNMTIALINSFDDLNIVSEDLFDKNYKIKDLASFMTLIERLELFSKNNTIFDDYYLNNSIHELIFWFYKRHLHKLGFNLYKNLEKTEYIKNRKFRLRDKVQLIYIYFLRFK